jgi:hypothetical protein
MGGGCGATGRAFSPTQATPEFHEGCLLTHLSLWLSIAALLASAPSMAACSGVITLAYSAPFGLQLFGALPEKQLPSLPDVLLAISGCGSRCSSSRRIGTTPC